MSSKPQTQKLYEKIRRVLILDSTRASAKLLSEMIRAGGASDIIIECDQDSAESLLVDFQPQIVFCEYRGPDLDGAAFVKYLRRSELRCRKIPVVMMTSLVTKAILDDAKNSGVDEFMAKPFAWNDVLRRLNAVFFKPRSWIEAVGYIGPDRRRFNSSEYMGRARRKTDKDSKFADQQQATRILRAAVAALDTDREQAQRSIFAQLGLLVPAVSNTSNPKPKEAVAVIIQALKRNEAHRVALEPYVEILAQHFMIDADPSEYGKDKIIDESNKEPGLDVA